MTVSNASDIFYAMFHFTSHKIINISHPIIESIFHQTRQRKKNSIDKSFLFYFYKTLKLYIDLSKIRCSSVSYFSNLVYVYVYACVYLYIPNYLFAPHTQAIFMLPRSPEIGAKSSNIRRFREIGTCRSLK